jgi:hypothetical protein
LPTASGIQTSRRRPSSGASAGPGIDLDLVIGGGKARCVDQGHERWLERGRPQRRACVVPRPRQRWQGSQTLARRWLCGELDGQVALPIGFVCDMLGLDAGVLAAAVRARVGP